MNKEGIELVYELNQYIIELQERNKALVNRVNILEKSLSNRRSSNTSHQLNNIK